ncbi:3-dehydroquinate dehydratase, type II [Exophiala mesophila]|uniref:Catabolic 3-dehydroquinase n=1 Tax=Exophiala mesophila TaxID=212818 RepID=A0A0D1ZQQ9_EXOME|nr:3-dehydroquinate dehydratase, type II [Exophiala mesophila]KIV96922.1 3-dehydroquinate dehydratase, type II [Exophiala mesophila]
MSTSTESSSAPPARKILLINGPNLNLLGMREPHIYGSTTLAQVNETIVQQASTHKITVVPFQSNHEGQIVDFLHSHFVPQTNNTQQSSSTSTIRPPRIAAIINPGAFTHTSVAIRDALLGTSIPFVEVHISNVHAREEFRHKSFFSDKASGIVVGLGVYGYEVALEFWRRRWDKEDSE